MPRPRFEKLAPERRTALLEAAAQEFGEHGYEGASINRILERAGVSKGAAYYYFDDKQDLFLTVVRFYMEKLDLNPFELPEIVDAGSYWPAIRDLYRNSFLRSYDVPWGFGVWRAAGELWRGKTDPGVLADFANATVDVLNRLFKRGQDLGVIRTDLPDDLVWAWARAVDDAHDRWVLEHWAELDREALAQAADRVVDGLQRLLGCQSGGAP